MPANFSPFFRAATGNTPYNYQCRLAGVSASQISDPASGMRDSPAPCTSRLISIPTGLGKTDAVVLAWLWNRVAQQKSDWPRRLVYCLPMRTLAEQTRDKVTRWITNLQKNADALQLSMEVREQLIWLATHSPIVLMGGADADEWDVHPERPAILIGTQDMLLSRALNRGYGMARARWPMHFGLLNNDALWVMDEVQLMDVGLATSAQLQAFRQGSALLRPCHTWWMSATLRPDWLETVDTHDLMVPLRNSILEIATNQRQGALWSVSKPCQLVPAKDAKDWARQVWEAHTKSVAGEHGRITLVVANTVDMACQLHSELAACRKKAKSDSVDLRLAHSRFRGIEREAWRGAFLSRATCQPTADRIVVATQIVEAGVDISATTLFTELAPWPSLVQRFGRAARYGGTAQVFVVDRGISEKSALPYKLGELEAAKTALGVLPDASLASLATFQESNPDLLPRLFPYAPLHLLLKRELEELFDTTPDLSGADLDISRFIRSGEERDVLIFWRDVPARSQPADTIQSIRSELCPLAVGKARDWLTDGAKGHAWVWDYLDGCWRPCRRDDIFPGQTILVACSVGGYDIAHGWTGETKDHEFPVETGQTEALPASSADNSASADTASQSAWETIAVHGWHVAQELTNLASGLALPSSDLRLLELSGRWHDAGKAHPAFQASIKTSAEGHPGTADMAKAPRAAWCAKTHLYTLSNGERRRGFRHELASTLALFGVLARHQPNHQALLGGHEELFALLGFAPVSAASAGTPTPPEEEILALDQPAFDLLAYLVCAHHGKVRVAWHTTPADQEFRDRDGRGLPLHGIRAGDILPSVAVVAADGHTYLVPELCLDLEPARLGLSPRTGVSWSERVAGLLATCGPFQLAYLEALLRAADARASRAASADSLPLANAAAPIPP